MNGDEESNEVKMVMIKNMNLVVTMVLDCMGHPHPGVRFASMEAIRKFWHFMHPHFHEQCHHQVVPALTKAMDDDSVQVQVSVIQAVASFLHVGTPEYLTLYIHGLHNKLLQLSSHTVAVVQESASTVLTLLAKHFKETYGNNDESINPLLKASLVQANFPSKDVEMFMSLGKPGCSVLPKQIMEAIMSLQGSQEDTNTIVKLQAINGFCKAIGKGFLPFTSIVMPLLLQCAQLEPDKIILSPDSDHTCLDDYFLAGGILGRLIESFKVVFLPYFDELSLYLIPMWDKEMTILERCTSLYIFGGLVKHCAEAALKYCNEFLPLLLKSSNDENPAVRQNALYGLGFYAVYHGSVFKPFVREAMSRINVVIMHLRAREPENELAYDSAVFTLGKIFQFHRELIDSAQVIPIWLNCLPIKGDLHEAKYVHGQLCSMVERSDRELLGTNYEHFPKIMSIFAEVICGGKHLATEETTKCMINLLRNLLKELPPDTLTSAWSLILPQQEMELKAILFPGILHVVRFHNKTFCMLDTDTNESSPPYSLPSKIVKLLEEEHQKNSIIVPQM